MFDFDLESVPMEWRDGRIPKRHGGFRRIHIPCDELKDVQHRILTYLYSVRELKVSGRAFGFIPHRNTLMAMSMHDNDAPVYLSADVKDFFDNFPVEPVRRNLVKAGIPALLVEKILKACTLDGHFPQGGPCSPYLTNVGMLDVDRILAAYARKHGLTYTRYADDLQFSLNTEKVPCEDERRKHAVRKSYFWVFRDVNTILRENLGLELKKEKSHTIRMKGRGRTEILGIVRRKDGLGNSAPRNTRRKVRAALHNLYEKVTAQGRRLFPEDRAEWAKVAGYIRYADGIRSDNLDEARGPDPMFPDIEVLTLMALADKGRRKNGRPDGKEN